MSTRPAWGIEVLVFGLVSLFAVLLFTAEYVYAESASYNVPVHILESKKGTYRTVTDPMTGAAVYTIPIQAPPGRAGVEPTLSFTYNSGETDNANIAGYGWDIQMPSISRNNKEGVNNLYDEDDYVSSFDGELIFVSATSGVETYKARFDSGSFNVYEYDGTGWEMTAKDGTMYSFGTAPTSQQSTSTSVYRWMASEMRDTNDNFIRYEYFKDAGQIYP